MEELLTELRGMREQFNTFENDFAARMDNTNNLLAALSKYMGVLMVIGIVILLIILLSLFLPVYNLVNVVV